MIKLTLPERPAELTDELQSQLTEKFKINCNDDVWNDTRIKNAIRNTLLNMTHSKCAYSEQPLSVMEIDHFKCKSIYKDDVVKWGNLLPSCRKCNSAKSDHDVVAEPIINPLIDNPKDFLYVKSFRFYPRNNSVKGKTTIDVLDINDKDCFEKPRAETCFDTAEKIENLFDLLQCTTSNTKRRNVISKIKSALEACGPKYEYSAVISTYILYEYPTYQELENYLRDNNLWDSDFDTIKHTLEEIAMPK